MKSNEFVDAVSAEGRLTKTQANEAIHAVFTAMAKALVANEKVSITGFGIFDVKVKPAHTGINPATKEKIEIPERKAVVFKAAKNLKDSLN
ncbi:MAG TPA: DNA-binding protein [Firmicutes bacterium]|nr:DNA-binding protein [Bacillota bacterium]